jgi:hypothetical protein
MKNEEVSGRPNLKENHLKLLFQVQIEYFGEKQIVPL